MSTVCGATFGEVSKNKKSRRIIQSIIKECIDVAKAKNIKVEPIQGKDVVKLLDYHNKLKKWLCYSAKAETCFCAPGIKTETYTTTRGKSENPV